MMRQNYLAAQRSYSRIWSNRPQCWDTKRGSRWTLLLTVTAIVAIKIVVSAEHINELYLNFISVLVVIERLRLIRLSILLVLIVDSEKIILSGIHSSRRLRETYELAFFVHPSFTWCHSPTPEWLSSLVKCGPGTPTFLRGVMCLEHYADESPYLHLNFLPPWERSISLPQID